MDCCIGCFVSAERRFYRSFIVVGLLLITGDAFSFRCNRELKTCTLKHWNPDEEGYFVLQHVPVTNSVLRVIDFLSATIDARFFNEVHPINSVDICMSANIKRLTLPENSTIVSLVLEKTRLAWAQFEENFYLQHLSIVECPLKIPFASFRSLKHLKKLTLRKTGIGSINFNLLCKELQQLETLAIDQNEISAFVRPDDRECESRLTYILMRNNKLQSINLHDFAPFTNLQEFDFAYNKIESITDSLMNVALSRLGLAGNRLKNIDFCHWNKLNNVSDISLAFNNLVRIPRCLHTFPNVAMLYLQGNQITYVDMDELAVLENLRVINLASNKIYSTSVQATKFPPMLVQLFLYDNCICKMVVPDKQLMPYTNLTIYLHKLYGNVLNIIEYHCKTCEPL